MARLGAKATWLLASFENVRASTLDKFRARGHLAQVSLLFTDQWVGSINTLEKNIRTPLLITPGQYVIGAIHTNTIEGFWSLIKRGCVGTFHKVSKKYLPLYVAEFQFRYNNRENADIFGTAIEGC